MWHFFINVKHTGQDIKGQKTVTSYSKTKMINKILKIYKNLKQRLYTQIVQSQNLKEKKDGNNYLHHYFISSYQQLVHLMLLEDIPQYNGTIWRQACLILLTSISVLSFYTSVVLLYIYYIHLLLYYVWFRLQGV